MQLRWLSRSLLLLVFSSVSLFSQIQTPTRDQQALTIVQTAINNMGATNSASTIHDCVLTGTSDSDSNPDLRKNLTQTIAGEEFRFEMNSAKGSGFFVSGHGTPANSFNGKTTRINYHVARANLPFYLPGLLLSRELSNSNYSVKYVGVSTVGGRRAAQIHLSDGSDRVAVLVTPQEWYFDLSSGLPLSVEFHIPTNENAADITKGTYDFSDFRLVNGMLTPFQISFSQEHLPVRTISLNSVTFNAGVSPSIFDAPKGAAQ
jgi:hypothetical protein